MTSRCSATRRSALSGRNCSIDGSLQECGGVIWRFGDGWNWGKGQAADDPRYCYMRDADYVSAAALMISADLFAKLGKFDEHYLPGYYEDTELCFRAREAGYRVVVQPAAEIVHFEGASAGTSTAGSGMKRFQAINHRKFFERWKETLASHRFNGELPELEAERTVERRALFIDDSVPEPDKDAGSNAALAHAVVAATRLQADLHSGDNMAGWALYRRLAAPRDRCLPPLMHRSKMSSAGTRRQSTWSISVIRTSKYARR